MPPGYGSIVGTPKRAERSHPGHDVEHQGLSAGSRSGHDLSQRPTGGHSERLLHHAVRIQDRDEGLSRLGGAVRSDQGSIRYNYQARPIVAVLAAQLQI